VVKEPGPDGASGRVRTLGNRLRQTPPAQKPYERRPEERGGGEEQDRRRPRALHRVVVAGAALGERPDLDVVVVRTEGSTGRLRARLSGDGVRVRVVDTTDPRAVALRARAITGISRLARRLMMARTTISSTRVNPPPRRGWFGIMVKLS